MVAALRAAGRETLLYASKPTSDPSHPFDWGILRPAEIINRYVDSGIPVLVGLGWHGRDIGHAVVATGQVLRQTATKPLPANPTRAEFCEAFYVNDDQLGPNLRVGVKPGSVATETPAYNIDQHCQYLMIPLPEKVYQPAEKAETIAWDVLRKYGQDWTTHKQAHGGKLGASVSLGDSIAGSLNAGEILARTYLTYGWKYQHRGMRNRLPFVVKRIIRNLEVPRFVYVTEFSTLAQSEGKVLRDRRLFGHCVVDASAKNHEFDSVLMFHSPGMCFWHSHDLSGAYVRSVSPIKDDVEYYPKVRGEIDFASYET